MIACAACARCGGVIHNALGSTGICDPCWEVARDELMSPKEPSMPDLMTTRMERLVAELRSMTAAGLSPVLTMHGDAAAEALERLGGERDLLLVTDGMSYVRSFVALYLDRFRFANITAFRSERRHATPEEIDADRPLHPVDDETDPYLDLGEAGA